MEITRAITQGARATQHGKTAEDVIYAILKPLPCRVQRQAPVGKGMYETEIRVDFLVTGIDQFPKGLIIESKWQDSAGSNDEKLAYLWLNIIACYPCPTIIIVDGGGFREGAIKRLREQVDGQRIYQVFTIAEFISWVNRTLMASPISKPKPSPIQAELWSSSSP